MLAFFTIPLKDEFESILKNKNYQNGKGLCSKYMESTFQDQLEVSTELQT